MSGMVFEAVTWAALAFHFVEINPAHSTLEFKRRVERALNHLCTQTTVVAIETCQSIQDEWIQIDDLGDMTYEDFLHILHDFDYFGTPTGLKPEDHETLLRRGSKAMRTLRKQTDGFMWDTRVYVDVKLAEQEIALTLVHETNHVLNRSERKYYESYESAFIEEYRAFLAEAMYLGLDLKGPLDHQRIKKRVQREYGFEDVDLSKIPDEPHGEMIPSPKAWTKRGPR